MDELRSEAKRVYELLTKYLEIHKKMFKTSFKELGAALGISTPVPYSLFRDELANIKHELGQVIQRVDRVEGDKQAARVLKDYTRALSEAVGAIMDVCSRFADVSAGIEKSYNRKEYKRDVKAYNELIRKYKDVGMALNEFFPNISGKAE